MRNELSRSKEVAFDRPLLPSCFPDTEEILLLSQRENERIERACEGDSLPHCVSLRIPWVHGNAISSYEGVYRCIEKHIEM